MDHRLGQIGIKTGADLDAGQTESLLQIDELNGLEAEKLAKILAMSRF